MMRSHKRRSAKTGLPPGALVHLGDRKTRAPAVSLIEYGPEAFTELRFASMDESRAYRPTQPTLWLNVHGLHEPEVMAEIGRRFDLHPLVIEDILNTDQRPKLDDYGRYLFIVTRFFAYDPVAMTVSSEQLSLVVGAGFVLTFQERPTGSFDPVRERLRQDRGQIRRMGADYLAYTLLDILVDRYFLVLEQVGERSEQLEDALMQRATPAVLHTLHQLKRETLTLRRAIWPLREIINTLSRTDHRIFRPETLPYLRDVYDHTVHAIESLEATRDLIAGLLDIYLSSISNRVNQEVRALTVIAIIFMPTTMIAGIFGMNFKFMPLVEQVDGFYLALGLMTGVAATLGAVFWRKKWLG